MAELYGKIEGCSHGYGGSMHLYDVERGNLGANAVVGGGLPAITGAALAFKMRGEPRVAVAFFGDGATNIGMFHEALNLAVALEGAGGLRPREQPLGRVDAGDAAAADHRSGEARGRVRDALAKVDGQDVEAVYKAAKRALEYARSGKGPVYLVCETYRLVGHFVGDAQVYRPKGEHARAARDAGSDRQAAREARPRPTTSSSAMDAEALEIAEASVEFAKAGTDPKPEDALKNVYA